MRNTRYEWLCLWRGHRFSTVAPTLMQARDTAQYVLLTLYHLRANQEDITTIRKREVKGYTKSIVGEDPSVDAGKDSLHPCWK